MKKRYRLVCEINDRFGFVWRYLSLTADDVKTQAEEFCEEYSVDVSKELTNEVLHLRAIHRENFGQDSLSPLQLLNRLKKENLSELFPNICVALRILCSLPVSTAECERCFSFLARIKDELRSTISQERLSALGMLGINVKLARTIDFDVVINDFAAAKARKAHL